MVSHTPKGQLRVRFPQGTLEQSSNDMRKVIAAFSVLFPFCFVNGVITIDDKITVSDAF